MPEIVKTKIYSVSCPRGTKIYISEHSEGSFYGSILYFDKINHPKDPGFDVDVKLESFLDTNEKAVYQRCIRWINENLGKNYEAKLVETRSHQSDFK